MLAIIVDAAFILGTIIDLAVLVLAIVAMIAILKLPALLERVAGKQAATEQVMREVLAEIRSVTRQG